MNKCIMKRLKSICMAACVGIGLIQIYYALLWAFQNGTNIQDFYDTAIYMENAVLQSGDGWRLMGYSVVLRPFLAMQDMLGDYFIIPLYIVQALISLLCFAQGFKTFGRIVSGKEIKYVSMLLPAVYILTVPIVWQMQFAVLPDALCVALVVLLFSKLAECMWDSENMHWDSMLIILGCLLMLSMLHRHYFYGAFLLGAVCGLIVLFRSIHKKYRRKENFLLAGSLILCIFISAGLSVSVNSKMHNEESYVEYSLAADLWDGFIYPNIREDYSYYPETVREVLPVECVEQYGDFYERYMTYIAPVIAEASPENTEKIFIQMVETGIAIHKEEMVTGLCKEGISYALLPVAMIKYMYFNGNSLYGHNLVKMYETNPDLTLDYMHIGMNGFAVVSVLGILMYAAEFVSNKSARYNRVLILLYGILGIMVMMLPFMILTVIRFDYRYGLFPAFIWGTMALLSIYETENKTV